MDVKVTNNFAQVQVAAIRDLGAARQRLTIGLDVVGMQAIDFATSFTNKLSPPVGTSKVKRGGSKAKGFAGYDATYVSPRGRRLGPRRQHPGGWADDQVIAARSYQHEVFTIGGLLALEIRNTAEHAIHLENRGYGVIGFLFDGGYVPKKVQQMVNGLSGVGT